MGSIKIWFAYQRMIGKTTMAKRTKTIILKAFLKIFTPEDMIAHHVKFSIRGGGKYDKY